MKLNFKFLIVFTYFFSSHIVAETKNSFSDDIRIVVLGSSTAAGTGATPGNSWVELYREYLQTIWPDAEVINLAEGGYRTYHIMPDGFTPGPNRPNPDTNRNISAALETLPTAIIINLPSNDNANGYSIEEQLHNYDLIVETAETQNIPVWICSPQPINYGATINAKQMEMRDSTFSRYNNTIDFWNGLALANGNIIPEYNNDGTHLNDAGHAILFQRVVEEDIPNYDSSLPVSLIEFTGIYQNNSILLKWTTAAEINNSKFVLEKSEDGKSYYSITEIKGQGNSNYNTEYQYLDNNIADFSIYYYRLKDISITGEVTYHKEVSVSILPDQSAHITNIGMYPNPFNSVISISFWINIQSPNRILTTVYNIAGQEIAILFNDYVSPGKKILTWNGLDYNGTPVPSGVYIVDIKYNRVRLSHKITLVK